MQEILKEYGPAIITVVAVIALIVVVVAVIGSNADGVVGKAFSDLINNFFGSAQSAGGVTPTP